ncbi:MAG TPA: SAM-dependent chlorinase/fluorinase [Candidatus Limnocylindrales bacterium]|nr:SAM-dependent chlorinase/fluorinase [Candidatus Limnocylindrales bacterium]
MAGPYLSFLSDFGTDTAPAVCRGVIWSILPDARINDLTHSSRQFGIRDGAFLLWSSVPYLPVGVHLAVVDPGVGTARRPIALQVARGDRLVGPDNGLLLPAAERLGGVVAAHALENRALWRTSVSHTFHGRDLFAPVAAHLAAGTPIEEVGPRIDPAELVRLDLPRASVRDGGLDTSVLFVDAFGNCRLAGQPAELAALRARLEPGDRFSVRIGSSVQEVPWQPTFGVVDAGALLLYEDADYAGLAIGLNQGSAAERLGLATDTPVRIEPA